VFIDLIFSVMMGMSVIWALLYLTMKRLWGR